MPKERRRSERQVLNEAPDVLMRLRQRLEEILSEELPAEEHVRRCALALADATGVTILAFFTACRDSTPVTGRYADLAHLRVAVLRTELWSRPATQRSLAVFSLIPVARSMLTNHIFIGAEGLTKDLELGASLLYAGFKMPLVEVLETDGVKERKVEYRPVDRQSNVELIRNMFQAVADEHDQSPDLPQFRIMIPTFSEIKLTLWPESEAFRQHLLRCYFSDHWGIHKLTTPYSTPLVAPCNGGVYFDGEKILFVKSPSVAWTFPDPTSPDRVECPMNDAKVMLESELDQVFGFRVPISIESRFPVGRTIDVTVGESFWRPAGLPQHSVINPDAALKQLQQLSSDPVEAERRYKAVAHWAALVSREGNMLDARFVTGLSEVKAVGHTELNVQVRLGLDRQLANRPPSWKRREDGQLVKKTEDEYAEELKQWDRKEVLHWDFTNRARRILVQRHKPKHSNAGDNVPS